MNIRQIHIENIRCLRDVKWSVSATKAAGWHVILGNNGSGKSSFLRSIALVLTGPKEAGGLRQEWTAWMTQGEKKSHINLVVGVDAETDEHLGARVSKSSTVPVAIELRRTTKTSSAEIVYGTQKTAMSRKIWQSKRGWFSASYGPFRRFTGGDPRSERLSYSVPRLMRHLSIFDERVAFSGTIEWMQELQFRKLENDPEGQLLAQLIAFVNESEFLPSGVRLNEVTSRGVTFCDANKVNVDVSDLSDGYRSILSMTFELIRQLVLCYGPGRVFDPTDPSRITASGVVIIDEIDAHLHPTWQQSIGRWLCRHFPKMQFIVSTHSPLVCQAAEHGSVFLLPEAGSDESAKMLKGDELKRLVYGNVLDAYGTEAFGPDAAATRSPESLKIHQELASLNNKEILQGLSKSEKKRQSELRNILPSESQSME